MKYSLVLLASTAQAFPFMAPGLDAEARTEMIKRTTSETMKKAREVGTDYQLGAHAVKAAREYAAGKRQLGGIGGGLRQ